MSMNITFNTPKPDLETVNEINDLYLKTWLHTYPNKEKNITEEQIKIYFDKKNTPENINKRVEFLKNIPENFKYIIAKDENVIVGVCTAKIHDDINELISIYVDPEYQGKGIGKKFWGMLQSFFDPKKDIKVNVVDYNINAIKFYERLGFRDTGKRLSDNRFAFENKEKFTEMEMIKKR